MRFQPHEYVSKRHCKECFAANYKRYAAINRNKIRAWNQHYREQHREERTATQMKYAVTIAGRFTFGKTDAKRRGVEWLLTFEQYNSLLKEGICTYCDSLLNQTGIGLDRIDNNKPYTIENVLASCWNCNNRKGRIELAIKRNNAKWRRRAA